MRVRFMVVVLVGVLCVGLTAFAEGTFSSRSRRTSESDVSTYRKGAYTVYGRRLSPYAMSAYAGPRNFASPATNRQGVYSTIGRRPRGNGRGRHVPGLLYPRSQGQYRYSTNIAIEENFSWSGYAPYGVWSGYAPYGSSYGTPYGFTRWQSYQYPAYNYSGYYGAPYSLGPYYHYSYRRPIGRRFRPGRASGLRSYYYPYAGSGIDLRFRW